MDRASRLRSLLRSSLADGDPARRLSSLATLQSELEELETQAAADALRSGMSWRQIGEALGISKQAAHHRHSKGVSELDRAASAELRGRSVLIAPQTRATVRAARREAAAVGARCVGTEHLLLGLLQCGDDETLEALSGLGVTLSGARELMAPTVEIPAEAAARARAAALGHVPGAPAAQEGPDGEPLGAVAILSPLARRILSAALSECAATSSRPLGTLYLLRSLLAHPDGGAALTLERCGIDPGVALERIGGGAALRMPAGRAAVSAAAASPAPARRRRSRSDTAR
jgi:hypothetical protein